MTPKPPDKPKSIHRPAHGCCRWCGYGVNPGKIICEHCRVMDPVRAARIEKDERR